MLGSNIAVECVTLWRCKDGGGGHLSRPSAIKHLSLEYLLRRHVIYAQPLGLIEGVYDGIYIIAAI